MLTRVPYELGALYDRRRDIHERFDGQQRGGIATPSRSEFIFLFTGVGGAEHGYLDYWDESGYFHYFGEGQVGDMSFVRGNAAIAKHKDLGKRLLVFQMLGKKKPCRYLGEFELVESYYRGTVPDRNENLRTAIVFRLRPLDPGELPFENTIRKPTRAEIDLGSTVVLRLAEVRKKQDVFRRNLTGIERECRLTGVADLRFLRASHMKPWSACDSGSERVDGNNGLLLTPHADLLFDRGWITFENSGALCASTELPRDVVARMGLKLTGRRKSAHFNSEQQQFLAYHRDVIFDKKFKRSADPITDLIEVAAVS